MKYIITLISIIVFLYSCENHKHEYYKNTIEKYLNVHISNRFELINIPEDYTIGDYLEQFELKFSNEDFNDIFKIVKTTKYNDSVYFYNIKSDTNNRITIIFNTSNNTIKYTHYEE